MPYIYSLSANVTQKNYTPMRLLAFDFAKDKKVLNIKGQFMYGPSLLINPVTDSGATQRKVYLPEGAKWMDFWTGEMHKGGELITANASIARMPIFVKCGTILPLGPLEQYTDEKRADPIELRIYPGADGSFELYEDDGTTYNYKRGQSSKILFKWNDQIKTLAISAPKGQFKEMLKHRVFHVIYVNNENGDGFSLTNNYLPVNYTGKAIQIKLLSKVK
jgi:alpha-D-xyloside xylohydrolase